MFEIVAKQGLEFFMFLLNRNYNKGENAKVKIVKIYAN